MKGVPLGRCIYERGYGWSERRTSSTARAVGSKFGGPMAGATRLVATHLGSLVKLSEDLSFDSRALYVNEEPRPSTKWADGLFGNPKSHIFGE